MVSALQRYLGVTGPSGHLPLSNGTQGANNVSRPHMGFHSLRGPPGWLLIKEGRGKGAPIMDHGPGGGKKRGGLI